MDDTVSLYMDIWSLKLNINIYGLARVDTSIIQPWIRYEI